MAICDIHPHIISDDETRYPPAPLFGKRSDWSQERPNTVEALIAAMDEAGVDKAAVVHSSTTYGFDNSYVVDGCNAYPDRLIAVGSVDVAAPDAVATIKEWVSKGLKGLRIFTGGSTKDFDPIQTGPIGLPQVRELATRFANVNIILDHLARPDVLDGAPYANAQSLWDMADLTNVYMKLTPRIMGDVKKGEASAETFFPKVVETFGAQRLAWGSNFPTSPGTLSEIRATAQDRLACLSDEDRAWIFGKTAQKLYPDLAD
jgi:L-fuconolactonase